MPCGFGSSPSAVTSRCRPPSVGVACGQPRHPPSRSGETTCTNKPKHTTNSLGYSSTTIPGWPASTSGRQRRSPTGSPWIAPSLCRIYAQPAGDPVGGLSRTVLDDEPDGVLLGGDAEDHGAVGGGG